MSTRAQVRFAAREEGVSFSEHPEKINAQFYVHSDGYPEGLGLDIADSIMNNVGVTNWEIEPLTAKHGDLEYIYYIWQKPDANAWISIFEVDSFSHKPCRTCGAFITKPESKCIFVGRADKLINKYKQNTNDDG